MCSTLARMGMWRWCSEQWKAGPAQNPGSCNNSLWPTKTGTLDNGSAALEDSFPSRHLLCDLPRGKRNIYLPIYEVLMRHQSRILFESSLVTWEFSWLLTEAWVIKRQLHPRKYQLNIHLWWLHGWLMQTGSLELPVQPSGSWASQSLLSPAISFAGVHMNPVASELCEFAWLYKLYIFSWFLKCYEQSSCLQ